MREDKRILWTSQGLQVKETLEGEGIYYVKKEYIRKKYRETAWIFQTAYTYFCRYMEQRLPRPKEAESPVWLFPDPTGVFLDRESFLMKLELPLEEVVFFDGRAWNRVLNLELVGTEEERRETEEEWKRQGIRDSMEVFQKPFYPVLKKKITDSWEKIFILREESQLQAASWCLKKEWLADCRKYVS